MIESFDLEKLKDFHQKDLPNLKQLFNMKWGKVKKKKNSKKKKKKLILFSILG